MKHSPIQIRKEAVAQDIRELARQTGRSMTDAVALAVANELAKHRRIEGRDDRLERAHAAVARFAAAPALGPLLTDRDLYDDDGLPL